jgi:hypothetical protein
VQKTPEAEHFPTQPSGIFFFSWCYLHLKLKLLYFFYNVFHICL